MNVLIPGLSGFCPGVKNAENRIFDALNSDPTDSYTVLGMMINNRKYIEYLKEKNIETVDELSSIKKGTTVVIRTHGIDRKLQSSLSDDFNLIDLTCRNVKRVQEIIKDHSERGAMVFITGKKSHPEVIGLQSYGMNTLILENIEELDEFIFNPELGGRRFNPGDYSEIFVTSQTTGGRKLFESAIEKISRKWPDAVIESFDSICPVTEKKEVEALSLQSDADISFVIGDPLSSNANKLFKRLKDSDSHTLFIQDVSELKDLNIDFSKVKTSLVVSSASTPQFVESEVIEYLRSR
ncbi:MAG TPA: hypothetical protein DCO79_03885 [Spirochaeta sp.]|nr:hypothetical protein [Spirochaeta sp.]